MKLALNGALTIGTLDGANIEIRDAVGVENFYAFGLTAEEIDRARRIGSYQPITLYQHDKDIKRVLDSLLSGRFDSQKDRFKPIFDNLTLNGDYYCHLADFRSYEETQARIANDFKETSRWMSSVVMNIANLGGFSSDHTIARYAEDIWGIVAKSALQ